MANQMYRVTNNPYKRRNQVAALNARQAYLSQLIANQQRAEELARQDELNAEHRRQWKADYRMTRQNQRASQRMQRRQLAQSEAESRVGTGIKGAELGFSVIQNYGGDNQKTLGGLFGGSSATPRSFTGSNLGVGSLIGSGLAGFGAGSIFGGSGKKKKNVAKSTLFGAAGGGLMGLLGNSSGGGIGGLISGGIGGALSKLF